MIILISYEDEDEEDDSYNGKYKDKSKGDKYNWQF